MPAFEWPVFLDEFNRELFTDDEVCADVAPEVLESGWLGATGASEAEIGDLERRLGTKLPPSYRAFLAASNGWFATGPFIQRVFPASDVAWFRDRHLKDYIEPWLEGARQEGEPERVPDDKYFVYGAEQDCINLRDEYLETALQVAESQDNGVYLLNPKVVTPEGEWEAWFFAAWLPGAERYRSFRELMVAEKEKFLRLRDQRG